MMNVSSLNLYSLSTINGNTSIIEGISVNGEYMNPSYNFLPYKISLRLLGIYNSFVLRCPGQRPIRPVFLINPDAKEDDMKTIEQLDLNLIPILTGKKIKYTRLYMEGLREYMKHKQGVCLSTMQRNYFAKVVNEGQFTRTHALTLQANYCRRMNCASLVSRGLPCTKIDWNECYNHLLNLTLQEYLDMMDYALTLPKEWCDDESLNKE